MGKNLTGFIISFFQVDKSADMEIKFLEILVCPICKGNLIYKQEQQELVCAADKLAFPIENGIPVMLAEKSRKLDEAEQENEK